MCATLYNATTFKTFLYASRIMEAKEAVAVPTATMIMILPITILLLHAKAGLYFYISSSFTYYISTQLN